MSSKNPGEDNEPSCSGSGSSDSSSLTLEGLQKYLADKLRISTPKAPKETVLKEFNVEEIAELIKKGKCKNIITLAGAGISTSAGIPDFRSPKSGLYDNLKKYNLPHPTAVFELDFFEDNPKPFFALAKELYPGSFKPTPCHYFIKLLEQKKVLLRHYTQNIDTLERVAGISDDKLVEAHGTFYTGHCMECHKEYKLEWMKEAIFADKIPICEKCPGIVKPDIVFFGENLPYKFYECIETDFKRCDLVIVMGSSLVVQPFASLVDRVSDDCPRLLINREKVGQPGGIMSLLGFGGGLDFDSPSNRRDVAWLGDCDEGCHHLANVLGWGKELEKMVLEATGKDISVESAKKTEETSPENAEETSASSEKAEEKSASPKKTSSDENPEPAPDKSTPKKAENESKKPPHK